MHTLLASTIILLLYITLRSGDVAITFSLTRDYIRALLYGIVALLALIALILSLL